MRPTYPRTTESKLSFRGERLLRGRHRLHPYPAMLHPLLVDRLLRDHAGPSNVVLDPFCGSGVTLLQSAFKGHAAIGFDLNPLALTIARAKTQTYQRKQLLEEIADLEESISTGAGVDIPPIKNMDYWYSPEVARDLGCIRHVLARRDYTCKDFLMAAFAHVCRNQSWTRNGEFKRFRMKEDLRRGYPNRVFSLFMSHVREMSEVMLESGQPAGSVQLARSDSSVSIPARYDMVITSPPYGDSRTTVAYGQYTSFGMEWLRGLLDAAPSGYRGDAENLGKPCPLEDDLRNHRLLSESVGRIAKSDQHRGDEVLHFFHGYYRAVRNAARNLNAGGTACFVVGNRTVKGVRIPMDQITASFLEMLGLAFAGILVREISNKVMPSRNSPTNKAGIRSRTMSHEYIVIFTKD